MLKFLFRARRSYRSIAVLGFLALVLSACGGGDDGATGATGATGSNGSNGLNSLIRTSNEPAGANCAAGGTKVEAGLDANNDGTLQDREISSTSYVCSATAATPPSTPTGLSVSYSVKSYAFTWSATASATHYELVEDPDDAAAQTEAQIGGSIAATSYTHSLAPQLLHQRLNASYRLRACNANGCSAYSAAITPNLTQAIGYFKASNTGAGDRFGWSVALSSDGSTLAVGAYGEQSNATGVGGDQANNSAGSSGAVYVYTRSGDTWSQQAYIKASNTGASDNFGSSVALSRDGNTLAVGATGEDVSSGAVYVFTRSGTAWSQQSYIKASNTGDNDYFGSSVALSSDGNTLAVGASEEDSNATGLGDNQADNSATDSGAVYVFTRSGTAWSQQAYIKASNTEAGDQFGGVVALSGDGNTLAVGARDEDSNATGVGGDQANNSAGSSGAVYVYTRSAGTWSQQAYIKASNTGAGDNFGYSVALSSDGNTLAAGAFGETSNATGVGGNQADNSTSGAGAAYLFTRSAGTWSQQAYIKASNTGAGDFFGHRVALSGDGNTLAVGAYLEDSNATGIDGNQADNSANNSGAVYVFTRSGSTWSQQAYVKASNTEANNFFGWSVALSADGNTLAVGAYNEDSNATGVGGNQADNSASQAGAVYIY